MATWNFLSYQALMPNKKLAITGLSHSTGSVGLLTIDHLHEVTKHILAYVCHLTPASTSWLA